MAERLFTDHLSRKVELHWPPQRIVSLVPSITETLYDLGLRDEVVGITRFCIHPAEWFQSKQRIGGTKDFRLEDIRSLEPDLIIANKEENDKALLEELASEYPVWISEVSNLAKAFNLIKDLGELVGKSEEAQQLRDKTVRVWESLPRVSPPQRAAYLIWKDPYMCAGSGTYIDSVLKHLGFVNAVKASRYPILSVDQIKSLEAEVLFLSSEPFPFKQKHIDELKMHLETERISLVDGEAFSWYGSRMLKSASILKPLVAPLYIEQKRIEKLT